MLIEDGFEPIAAAFWGDMFSGDFVTFEDEILMIGFDIFDERFKG